MTIICLLIYLIFATIWYLPLYRKQPLDETRLSGKDFGKATLLGVIPAFIISVFIQGIFARLMSAVGIMPDAMAHKLLMNIIGYAIVEELMKYFWANRMLKKTGFKSVLNTALLFGAVGAGFGLIESIFVLLTAPNIINAIMRGVVSLHVFTQLWMGLYIGKSLEIKDSDPARAKKYLRLAFAVPIIIHAIQDVSGTLGTYYIDSGISEGIPGFIILVVSFIIDVIFLVTTLKSVRKEEQ